MLAWNAPFRTKTEQIMWRISAPSLKGYGFLFVRELFFRKLNRLDFHTATSPREMNEYFWRHEDVLALALTFGSKKGSLLFKLVATALTLIYFLFYYCLLAAILCEGFLYVLERVFLVVESFLSLFHSPPGLFRQPNWGPYFPHMS